MKTFAIGDIHGRYKALLEVLQKSSFNYDEDTLIILGDIVDGDDRVKQCVDELLKIKNKIFVLGNHDKWFLDWIETEATPWVWTQQGGQWTLKSYDYKIENVPESHKEFFRSALKFYVDKERRLFVHGGLSNINRPVHEHTFVELSWDRSMIDKAKIQVIPNYRHIFVGHTTTQFHGGLIPLTFNNVTLLDTGAGWNGRLSIMSVDTMEYWQSKKQKPYGE